MRKMTRLCIVLPLLMLTSSPVGAQGSEIITVTGFYIQLSGEYENGLLPCQSREVWDLATNTPAFTTLSQQYATLEQRGQLGKYRELFVELRGRYTAYEGEAHSDGVFEITEVVRHSTAAVDPATCPLECEDIHGANSPTCLAQIDGQCGSTRKNCVAGLYSGRREADTTTEYRWECLGLYGGDSVVCTAPKVP